MYPGIGPKSAERLAFFTLQKMSKENVQKFSEQLKIAVESIKKCEVCGMLAEKDKCSICEDEKRENTILVVESAKDVNVFEQMKQYHGKYHVLNGLISPLKGAGPDDIGIEKLEKRITDENICYHHHHRSNHVPYHLLLWSLRRIPGFHPRLRNGRRLHHPLRLHRGFRS